MTWPVKLILFLLRFKQFRVKVGPYFMRIITNKEFPKPIDSVDTVYENEYYKAKLKCEGYPPHVKCKWIFEEKRR